jgi:ABC-2 type transport system ATP-binding protein
MGAALIETWGLRKQFGAKVAVEDLSLTVHRGEVFCFLGPNGAGKTTSIKMLLGLVPASAGSGEVLGARLGDRLTRARIGFLPEHFRFQDWLTGHELLTLHGRLVGLRGAPLREQVERWLGRVDLLDAMHRPIRTYSKGMMQRAGLAQALMNDPDLVFLDEPTSGLDPLGRLMVRDIIAELRGRGTTVFLNSHLLGEVEATCTRVVFVKEGRTVDAMTLGASVGGLEVELRTAPLAPEALESLARLGPITAGPTPAIGDGDGDPATVRTSLRLPGDATLPQAARLLVDRGVAVYEIKVVRQSLEAKFLEIMGADRRPG